MSITQLLFLSALYSCEKVSQLSNNNTIVDFSIENVAPEGVVLKEPIINDNSIEIPVLVGKYLFPIKIKPVIGLDDKTAKILGIPDSGTLEFESYTSVKTINIVSQSGMTKRYEVKLTLLPTKESSDILSFKTTSDSGSGLIIAKDGYPDPTKLSVTIFAINSSFPLTLKPEINISEGATISNWTDGELLTFTLQGETKKLNILSESGRQEEWTINIKNAIGENLANQAILSSISDRMHNPFSSLNVKSEKDNITIDTATILSDKRVIQLFYSNFDSQSDIAVKFEFDLNRYLTSTGFVENNKIILSSVTDTESFYVIDNITGIYSEWMVTLRPSATLFQLTEFSWGTFNSVNGDLRIGPAEINHQKRVICIPVLNEGKFPLKISNIKLSSEQPVISNIPEEYIFNSVKDELVFDASLNGINESWKVIFEERFKPLSENADVIQFETGKPSFSYTIDEVYIEPSTCEIVIISENFTENLSLKIAPTFQVSAGAKAEGIVSGGIIELEWGNPYQFKVKAEDGTTKSWQIKVIPAPQIPNADMEEWWSHPQFKTIKTTIYPSDGSGWDSSNNPNVTGVIRTPGYNSQYGAMIKTSLSTISFADIIKVTSLTAGNLFLGKFKYSTFAGDVYNPSSMLVKGIPYNGLNSPKQLKLMYKYKRGDLLVKTSPKTSSTTIPAFNKVENLNGYDSGEVIIEFWGNDNTQLTASGIGLFDHEQESWREFIIEITPASANSLIKSKFISISFTSSIKGYEFTGADGSILEVDQLRLVYHKPGIGSLRVK